MEEIIKVLDYGVTALAVYLGYLLLKLLLNFILERLLKKLDEHTEVQKTLVQEIQTCFGHIHREHTQLIKGQQLILENVTKCPKERS